MDIEIFKSAAQAHGFYDMPYYTDGQNKPSYYDLFIWKCHSWSGDPNDKKTYCGILNEELFDTIEKKIAYIQGIFTDETEGLGIIKGENWIQFANSLGKVERCKNWLKEIIKSKLDGVYIGIPEIIRFHNIRYGFPICSEVGLNPKVVDFIKNYKF